MNLAYVKCDKEFEVYYGQFNKVVTLVKEVNKFECVSVNDNFFDMSKCAGEGNIGRIIEEIKINMSK